MYPRSTYNSAIDDAIASLIELLDLLGEELASLLAPELHRLRQDHSDPEFLLDEAEVEPDLLETVEFVLFGDSAQLPLHGLDDVIPLNLLLDGLLVLRAV